MGVVSDDVPPGAVLHSLLTLNKAGGGKRWVITAMTANDITVDFYHYQADNADELQQVMQGAKHYWVADLTKGYWQVRATSRGQPMAVLLCNTFWGIQIPPRPNGQQSHGPLFR